MTNVSDPDDLTARARIREAAIQQFGELGFDRATIRGIATAAGVSSGLVRHHYGSKQALREACDDHLTKIIGRLNEQAHAFPAAGPINPAAELRRYQNYLVRSLTDGGPSAIFDHMAALSTEWLAATDAADPDPPRTPATARAALLTAMSLSVTLLRPHLERGFGVDPETPEGELLLMRSLVDLYSHPILSRPEAERIHTALDAMAAGPNDQPLPRRTR
ncbi:TetR/AcrR family transcriptional regulator [Microlunatus sp. GCM10028923]|uniref:TetR/AcrR family transcriptional regulator n=1 Tax=Microlunatus sp. GCM10028923 TaxID=3273400 RepID=UPI0036072244